MKLLAINSINSITFWYLMVPNQQMALESYRRNYTDSLGVKKTQTTVEFLRNSNWQNRQLDMLVKTERLFKENFPVQN